MDDHDIRHTFAFKPNRERALHLDRRVRSGLADGLATILKRVGPALGVQAALGEHVVLQVRERPIAPRLMATYADLVEAIHADDESRARALMNAVLSTAPPPSGTRILDLTDAHLGAREAERYARFALAESEGMNLTRVGNAVHARVAALYEDAHKLLVGAAPELSGEIDALLRELVLVQGADSHSDGFDGATTFYLWGALLLNAPKLRDRIQLATAVVHECAHAFLFGVNLGAKLTLNDDAELCASPLRSEPRPVEGVFHATFVLARMIYALDRLTASDLLIARERDTAERLRASHVLAFEDGLAALNACARLSAEGDELLSSARAYALAGA